MSKSGWRVTNKKDGNIEGTKGEFDAWKSMLRLEKKIIE